MIKSVAPRLGRAFFIGSLMLRAAMATANEPVQTSDFDQRAGNFFNVVFPAIKTSVANAVVPDQRSIVEKTAMRLDPNCTGSPASTSLESGSPTITICTRSFRFFFEFIEWNAFLSAYAGTHDISAQSYYTIIFSEWHYLAQKAIDDADRANHKLPQEVVCYPYIRLYLSISNKPISGCERQGKVLDEVAQTWVFDSKGLLPDSEASKLFKLKDIPVSKEGKSRFLKEMQNAYIGWAYKFIILHEFGHILNGDLGGVRSERIKKLETEADQQAMKLVQSAFTDELVIAYIVSVMAETYFEPFRDGSAIAPIDQSRIEAAVLGARSKALDLVNSMSENQKEAASIALRNFQTGTSLSPSK